MTPSSIPASRSCRSVLALVALLTAFVFTGCPGTVGVSKHTVDELHAISTDLREKVQAVENQQKTLIEAQGKLDEKSSNVIQKAADQVAGAAYANSQNVANPYTALTGEKLATAAGLLGAGTEQNQTRVTEQLKLALSQSQADREALRLQLEDERKAAGEAKAAAVAAQTEVGAAKEKVAATGAELTKTVGRLDKAVDTAEINRRAAEEAAAAAKSERAGRTRLHVAYGFMSLGGLLIVAAIVATFLHVPGVLAGGLAGGAALLALGWLITVLEDLLQKRWFQIALGVVLLAALGIVALLVYRAWHTRKKAALDAAIGEGAIGAIQEAKNDDAKTGSTTFAALSPYLQEWFVDDDGKRDGAIEKEIDRRLEALNLKNPDGADTPVLKALRAGQEKVGEPRVLVAPKPVPVVVAPTADAPKPADPAE